MRHFRMDSICGDVSYLSWHDIKFLSTFGTVEKPISVDEFLIFWASLTMREKDEINEMYGHII